jgi:hypothetical protein
MTQLESANAAAAIEMRRRARLSRAEPVSLATKRFTSTDDARAAWRSRLFSATELEIPARSADAYVGELIKVAIRQRSWIL